MPEALDPVGPFAAVPPAAEGRLPPHTGRCMVCGPDAVAGYHLEPRRRGDEVVASFAFGPAHEGGPHLAHGGAVAAVCDDLLGHVLWLAGAPAVTAKLEVDYCRPVVLGEPLQLTARLDRRDGRKLWLSAEGRDQYDTLRFSARGLFVRVSRAHFLSRLPPEEREAAGTDEPHGPPDDDMAAW